MRLPIRDGANHNVSMPHGAAMRCFRRTIVGASMGDALYSRDGADGLSLLRHADARMYLDKGAGWERWYRIKVLSVQ